MILSFFPQSLTFFGLLRMGGKERRREKRKKKRRKKREERKREISFGKRGQGWAEEERNDARQAQISSTPNQFP